MSTSDKGSWHSENEQEKQEEDEEINENEVNKSQELEETERKEEIKTKKTEEFIKPNLQIEITLPKVACEEHIIFALDICSEEESSFFELSEGPIYTYLELMKRILGLFMANKKAVNHKHKFSLITLKESAEWVTELTIQPKDITSSLNKLTGSPAPSKDFDLTSLFDIVSKRVHFPEGANAANPPFIVRLIFLYNRSKNLLNFLNGKESFHSLSSNPYFFFDALFVHEGSEDDNHCEAIFSSLCGLDPNGWGYVFECHREAMQCHNAGAKLLAHPLQRPTQADAHYSLLMN